VARIEALAGALAKRDQPGWKWRLAVEANECFGANQVAGRAEQRMAPLDGAHLDPVDLLDSPLQNLRLDHLHAIAVGAKTLVADDQRQCNGVDAED